MASNDPPRVDLTDLTNRFINYANRANQLYSQQIEAIRTSMAQTTNLMNAQINVMRQSQNYIYALMMSIYQQMRVTPGAPSITYSSYVLPIGQMGQMPAQTANAPNPFSFENLLGMMMTQMTQPQTEPTPTEEQITRALQRTTYTAAEYGQTQSVCPIERRDFVEGENIARIRGCGHIFTPRTIIEWFHSHATCPVCRYNILNVQQRQEQIRSTQPPEDPQLVDLVAETMGEEWDEEE